MSEGHKIFMSKDGTQIMLDANTGKYYALETNNRTQGKGTQPNQLINIDRYQEVNTSPLQYIDSPGKDTTRIRKHHSTVKQPLQQTKKQSQCNTSSQQQNKQNQTNTWQNNTTQSTYALVHQTNTPVEHTSTPRITEQAQATDYEERKDESCINLDEQQDSATIVNKRTLNDSDEFITVKPNKARKNDHNKEIRQMNLMQPITTNVESTENFNKYNIPLEHIQRAVIHNLPCFIISFKRPEQLPSAVAVSEDLYEHFKQQNLRIINGFSVVRYVGNQLKIGVKNKEDYQRLCDHKIWPSEIQGHQITVTMPKFIPDQFSLVVRYIPLELSVEQVTKEVQRSASTANNFRAIIYPYRRATNDFRFTVSDQKEYNGLLRLGHIGVGNKMSIVTTYRPANKLTFCNKCWVLDHTRNKCQFGVQKCRICLQDYDENHNEVCSKQYECAQCHQEHYSLDSECKIIQQYRSNLNKAVKQAKEDGTIKPTQSEVHQPLAAHPPKVDLLTFPQLSDFSNRQISRPPPWKTTTFATAIPEPDQIHCTDISNQQLFEKLCSYLDERSEKMDLRIRKVEHEIKSNEKNVVYLRQCLSNLVDQIKSIITDIIPPLTKSVSNVDSKTKEEMNKATLMVNDRIELIQNGLQMIEDEKKKYNEVMEDQLQVDQTDNSKS